MALSTKQNSSKIHSFTQLKITMNRYDRSYLRVADDVCLIQRPSKAIILYKTIVLANQCPNVALCHFCPQQGVADLREYLKKNQLERFKKFMSTDWLPLEEARIYSNYVYTEPCWTRTKKGILLNRKVDMDRFYDIFTIYKEKGRVLAEGN